MNTSPLYEQLVARKIHIEEKMNECNQVLISEGNVGLNGPLIDPEGYPRADIDIYKVRMARQTINRLRNDYNALLVQIEQELISIHSQFKAKEDELVVKTTAFNSQELIHHKPFAKVTQVDLNSPASEAGIKINDEIIQFGPYTHTNVRKNLAEIAELVRSHENKIILLNIQRVENENGSNGSSQSEQINKKLVKVKLIPKYWSGHGLLGCKIVPID